MTRPIAISQLNKTLIKKTEMMKLIARGSPLDQLVRNNLNSKLNLNSVGLETKLLSPINHQLQ